MIKTIEEEVCPFYYCEKGEVLIRQTLPNEILLKILTDSIGSINDAKSLLRVNKHWNRLLKERVASIVWEKIKTFNSFFEKSCTPLDHHLPKNRLQAFYKKINTFRGFGWQLHFRFDELLSIRFTHLADLQERIEQKCLKLLGWN